MHQQKFRNVVLDCFGRAEGPLTLSSAEIEDSISELLSKLGIPAGTLERLSGISERKFWDSKVLPSEIATIAAKEALEKTAVDRSRIGVIINCSVSRDYFEPATASILHRTLGFPSSTVAFDISNACLGFSNALSLLGTMIDSGQIEAGLIVSGETVAQIFNNTIQSLTRRSDITRDNLLQLLPVLTLGCGGIAAVVCHEKFSKNGHRPINMVSATASEYNDLCNGNGDFCVTAYQDKNFNEYSNEEIDSHPLMFTEASKLIYSASLLGGKIWPILSELTSWKKEDVDHIFCHQVGKQVNDAFYKEIGLPIEKEFNIYKEYGNMVSVALPSALVIGAEKKPIKKGEKVVTMGFGSGLNSVFTAWSW